MDERLERIQVLLVLLKSQYIRLCVLIFVWLSVIGIALSKNPLRKRGWRSPNNNGDNTGSKAVIDTWGFYGALNYCHRFSGFKQHLCIVSASPKQKFWPSVAWLALSLDSHQTEIKVLAVLNCFMEAMRINVLLISLNMWAEFHRCRTEAPFPGVLPCLGCSQLQAEATRLLSHASFSHLQS